MFSSTCPTRLAPVITEDTFGLLATQAMESWDSVQPRLSATSLSERTLALLSLLVRRLASHS